MKKILFPLLCFMMLSQAGKASVVITDIVPDSMITVSGTASSWFSIDLDHNLVEDFNIQWNFKRFGTKTISGFGPSGNEIAVNPSTPALIEVNGWSELIDGSKTWGNATLQPAIYNSSSSYSFADSGNRFIGVRFYNGTNVHYGWILINFNLSSKELTVLSYAYETTPGTAITTPLSIDFSASSTTTDTKTIVAFTDHSHNFPTAWEWTFTPATVTFMSGTGPTSQNPQVKFNNDGKYTVKLKATSKAGTDSITKTDYITILTAPTVNFTASTVTTDTKTTVTFTEACTNIPTAWEWSFTPTTITYMAGTGSTSKNPQVKFNVAGKYTVKLKASNTAGTDSSVKTNYVTVTDTPTSINNYGMINPAVTMYPNPASKFFIIENQAGEGRMTILDLNGRIEFSQELTGKKTEIDIRQLPKGYHMLRIATPDGVHNTKLAIE